MGKMARRHTAYLEEKGSEWIFSRYLEHGSVKKALASMTEVGRDEGVTIKAFYDWMDADESGARRREWERVKEGRGMTLIEEALEEADKADRDNYNAQRLKVDARIKIGSRLNRRELAQDRGGVQVNVTVGGQLVELWEQMDAQEAEYEVLDTDEG